MRFGLSVLLLLIFSSVSAHAFSDQSHLKKPASQPKPVTGKYAVGESSGGSYRATPFRSQAEVDRYAWAFAYVKNANQRITWQPDTGEPPLPHYNWALSHDAPQPVFSETLTYCDNVDRALKANSITSAQMPSVFADIKMASLYAEHNNKHQENFGKWEQWARSAPPQQLKAEIGYYIKQIRSTTGSLKKTADDLTSGGAKSPQRISNAFGWMKNAYLLQVEGRSEAIENHRNWARQQNTGAVTNEMKVYLDRFTQSFRGSKRVPYEAFACLKNTRLWLVEGREEPIQWHIGWAQKATPQQYSQAVNEELAGISRALSL